MRQNGCPVAATTKKIDIRQQLAIGVRELSFCEHPGLEAELLLAKILGKSRAWMLAHRDGFINAEQQIAFQALLSRRLAGEPLPYLLGTWEFFGLAFIVTADVLIPRPETELLVEIGIQWLVDHPDRKNILDVGTGSGCIAISLASRIDDLSVLMEDISWGALQVARLNVQRLMPGQKVFFIQGSLLQPFGGKVDLLCANLPYIPSVELEALAVARCEPRLALDGGEGGLELIRLFLQAAPACIAPGGLILMEIEERQGEDVQLFARRIFPNAEIKVNRDLTGKDRVLSIQQV